LSERLAAVVAVKPTGADIARDPQGSLALLAEAASEAVQRHGADVVVLGGAGLAGLAAPWRPGSSFRFSIRWHALSGWRKRSRA